ncbi:MAG: GGDEF domain-containing protein [Lachnospiraceae bacterium]|nr:GGDEF domain-containing protein [Lachnospiraceae bacterium]
MYYSVIGMVAIVLQLIMNHKFLKRDKKRDEVGKAFRKFVFASLMYYITDVLWGILNSMQLSALLYVDTIVYYISMALTIAYLCNYVTKYLNLRHGFGKFIRIFGQAFAALEIVLLIINHFVHIFFWIYPDGTYQAFIYRYIALYMQVFLCLLLSIQTGIVMIKAADEMKERYFTIFFFCSAMGLAIVLQILYPLLPIYAIGLLIGSGIIHTFVNEGERDEQFKVLQTMANIHYSMHVIDLVKDTVQELTARKEVKAIVNRPDGAHEMMRSVISSVTTDEYLQSVLEFTDLTTLAERMRNKETIAKQFVGKNVGWVQAMFIAIATDPYGKPTKVIYTTRVIEDEKKNEEILVKKSIIDELTGLYNRRAYEEDISEYSSAPISGDFIYASIDVNGLKVVNDEIGHAAGDELIKGAADCMQKAFGSYGKVYRTGGDEFVSIFFADNEQLEAIRNDLDSITESWTGEAVQTLSLSVGYVAKNEYEDKSLLEIAKIADKRMYLAQSAYYSKKGIDRRGQAAANTALCNLYTKILKVNITDDSYSIVNMDASERTPDKGFANTISAWLTDFGKSGQVHADDVENYLAKTDLKYLRTYFKEGKSSISIQYRRKYDDTFKQVAMDMIPADDYSDENQTLFLYVKKIDL